MLWSSSSAKRGRITDKSGPWFDRNVTLDFKLQTIDAPWEYSEEPHVQRRQMILKKHPEVKKLFGYDPMMAVYVGVTVLIQVIMCWLISDASWKTLIPAAWIISATLNHSLGGAIHEIGHNLAFGHTRPLLNRALGMIANLPFGIPMSVSYKKYHADHHRHLGHDVYDVDIPTEMETKLFRHWSTKLFWLAVFPIVHAIRPWYKHYVPILVLEIINFVVQISFDLIILYFFGFRSLIYLLLGTLLGLGLHPLAGHFISEHYLFWKGQATANYYGPLNFFIYNLGYHIEHHDFPYIPFRRLPELRKLAPEFYENIPFHTSWCRVLFDFVFRSDMGPYAHGIGSLPQGYTEDDMERTAKEIRLVRTSDNNSNVCKKDT